MFKRIAIVFAFALVWGGTAIAQPDCNGAWVGSPDIIALDSADLDTALLRLASCAEQGDALAQNALGDIYDDGIVVPEDDAEAARWYRLAAEQGLASAASALGNMYFRGRGVSQSYDEAARWLSVAAGQDDAGAQNNLGIIYVSVFRDYEEAARLFRTAAEHGHAGAQSNFGRMYRYGYGVLRDFDEAIRWNELAAEQGHVDAYRELGTIYLELWQSFVAIQGRGSAEEAHSQDLVFAYMWFSIALESGYAAAAAQRSTAANYMTDEQVLEAEHLLLQWIAAHPN